MAEAYPGDYMPPRDNPTLPDMEPQSEAEVTSWEDDAMRSFPVDGGEV